MNRFEENIYVLLEIIVMLIFWYAVFDLLGWV